MLIIILVRLSLEELHQGHERVPLTGLHEVSVAAYHAFMKQLVKGLITFHHKHKLGNI